MPFIGKNMKFSTNTIMAESLSLFNRKVFKMPVSSGKTINFGIFFKKGIGFLHSFCYNYVALVRTCVLSSEKSQQIGEIR